MGDIKLTKLASCSGCAAKVGAGTLAKFLESIKVRKDENLLVGFDKSDDAAVYKINDGVALVQTVDFFPPIADDPYLFGQIAATNALSDIYAMGGEPKIALNLLCIDEKMPESAVHGILRGGYDKVYEAGAVISGGHSIYDNGVKYGLSVTGFVHSEKVLTNSGAKAGDILFLTKPLGIGTVTTAAKADLCDEATVNYAYELMTTLNKYARDIMVKYNVHACTDVTGFGFLGHLYEMAQGSDVHMDVYTANISFIDNAVEYAKMGLLPQGMYRNRKYAEQAVEAEGIPLEIQDLLFDPQTSGGLLISVAPEDADKLYDEMKKAVPNLQKVGTVCEYKGGKRITLR